MSDRMRDPRSVLKLLVLLALTIGLVVLQPVAADRSSAAWLLVPPLALAFNFAVSGWIVLLSKVLRIRPPTPDCGISSGERRLYEALGVRVFKRFLRSGWYGSIWGPALGKSAKAASLEVLAADMRSAEIAHAIAFALVCLFSLFVLTTGRWSAAFWLVLCNILINAYPVMLQRYNRHRIFKALD
jgi:hypothetical protein